MVFSDHAEVLASVVKSCYQDNRSWYYQINFQENCKWTTSMVENEFFLGSKFLSVFSKATQTFGLDLWQISDKELSMWLIEQYQVHGFKGKFVLREEAKKTTNSNLSLAKLEDVDMFIARRMDNEAKTRVRSAFELLMVIKSVRATRLKKLDKRRASELIEACLLGWNYLPYQLLRVWSQNWARTIAKHFAFSFAEITSIIWGRGKKSRLQMRKRGSSDSVIQGEAQITERSSRAHRKILKTLTAGNLTTELTIITWNVNSLSAGCKAMLNDDELGEDVGVLLVQEPCKNWASKTLEDLRLSNWHCFTRLMCGDGEQDGRAFPKTAVYVRSGRTAGCEYVGSFAGKVNHGNGARRRRSGSEIAELLYPYIGR